MEKNDTLSSIYTQNTISRSRSAKHKERTESSTEELVGFLPFRPCRSLRPLLRNQLLQIQLPNPGMQIHVETPDHARPKPDLVRDIHGNYNRRCEIGLEEVDGYFPSRHVSVADGSKAGPELGHENKGVHGETEVGTVNAWLGSES